MVDVDATLVIRSGLLVDGRGGKPLEKALVAAAGKRLLYVGPESGAPAFRSARTLDLPGACLLPGLVDMHVHATFYWRESDFPPDLTARGVGSCYTPPLIALLAAKNLNETLMNGATTVRDTGCVDEIMFDVKRGLHRGLFAGSKVYVSGPLIVPTGGHAHGFPGLVREADGPIGFRKAVRQNVRAGADFIKLANDGQDLTQEELNAAVEEARRWGKKTAQHTGGPPALRMAIEAGVDTFEHQPPTGEEADRAAAQGMTWVPTLHSYHEYLNLFDDRRRHRQPEFAEQAEQDYSAFAGSVEQAHAGIGIALRAGLRIATGTDSWMPGVPFAAIANEICWLASSGCTAMQAIQAATASAAEAMGWNDIGTLEAGKAADVIAVPGDPLRDVSLIRQVMLVVCDGKVVKEPT